MFASLPNSSINVDGADLQIEIIMNIDKWWENPNTINLNDVTGIMGNITMQQKLQSNGHDVFSIGSIQALLEE